MSRSIVLGRPRRHDCTAFSRSRRKYFSTVWLIRRDSCTASPSVSIRNQALPFGASQTYCILLVLRSPNLCPTARNLADLEGLCRVESDHSAWRPRREGFLLSAVVLLVAVGCCGD